MNQRCSIVSFTTDDKDQTVLNIVYLYRVISHIKINVCRLYYMRIKISHLLYCDLDNVLNSSKIYYKKVI